MTYPQATALPKQEFKIKVFFCFFFLFSFTSLSSFFTHIETNQSVGGAKTGVPGEKPPDTPASRTWLVSHMNSCPVRGANPLKLKCFGKGPIDKMFYFIHVFVLRLNNQSKSSQLCWDHGDWLIVFWVLTSTTGIYEPYMWKTDFCLCENKGADQLCSNCTADQHLCSRYTDSTIPLLFKSKI